MPTRRRNVATLAYAITLTLALAGSASIARAQAVPQPTVPELRIRNG